MDKKPSPPITLRDAVKEALAERLAELDRSDDEVDSALADLLDDDSPSDLYEQERDRLASYDLNKVLLFLQRGGGQSGRYGAARTG